MAGLRSPREVLKFSKDRTFILSKMSCIALMISSSDTVITEDTKSLTGGHVRSPSLPCNPSAIVMGFGFFIILPDAFEAAQSAPSFLPAG